MFIIFEFYKCILIEYNNTSIVLQLKCCTYVQKVLSSAKIEHHFCGDKNCYKKKVCQINKFSNRQNLFNEIADNVKIYFVLYFLTLIVIWNTIWTAKIILRRADQDQNCPALNVCLPTN